MTDPTGHDASGIFKSGLGLFMAAVNAMALLTNDSNLSNAMSVFSLFIAVDNKLSKPKEVKDDTEAAKNNKPVKDPAKSGSIQDSNDSDHPTGKDTGSGEAATPPAPKPSLAETSGAEFNAYADKLEQEFKRYCEYILSPDALADALANVELTSDLINKEARRLGIDPNVLGAVILTESSGRGMINNKLVIRFEAHWFNYNSDNEYSQFFNYNSKKPWTEQQYRINKKAQWIDIHNNGQTGEYAAFDFALDKNETASYESISMGMGQIMGFNHQAAGFSSAKDMYLSFSKGSKEQVNGMIKFIENNKSMLNALKTKDYSKFVQLYNGNGQVDIYLPRLNANINIYQNSPSIINN